MTIKKESKRQYLDRRRRRVRELFRFEGLQPREIAEILVKDGTIETADESLESALRLVRSDVAEIRAEIDDERTEDAKPIVAANEVDALERELVDLRKERDRQQMIADGQPTEMCARSRTAIAECVSPECGALGKHAAFVGPAIGITIADTPQGPITTYKALWPAGIRQKASKDKAILIEKISKLEVALAERRRAAVPQGKDGEKANAKDDLFQIVTSGKPMNELIVDNATRQTIN
jgi:hypothetical protein